MAQIDYIKHLRDVKEMDINAIAKELKVNWRTVKKHADRTDWSEDTSKRKKTYRVLGNYIDIIEVWLLEDMRRHKKQRHTNIRIYHRLRDECGFEGGTRTVTDYVSKRKKELRKDIDKHTYIDLIHPGGEAQVDFGTAEIVHDQKVIQIKYLVMSFPYSNAGFMYILPAENAECLLYGLQALFERIGGVPRKLWFDNLSAAVVHIKKDGKRQLTDLFQRFKLHYGFQTTFCNPAKGNEKGNVENKVGTSRRNWLVPQPEMESWEQINEMMRKKANDFLEEIHYEKKCPIRSLWEEEHQKLRFLPSESFEVMKLSGASLDNYRRFRWEKEFFTVPSGAGHESVLIKAYWDRLEVLNSDYEKMAEFPRPYTFKEQVIDWKSELAIIQKKPRALEYTWVYSLLPERIQLYLNQLDSPVRKKRIAQLTKWLKEGYTINQVDNALAEVSVHLWDQEGIVYQSLYRQIHSSPEFEFLPEAHTPHELKDYEPDLNAYNRLVSGGARS